LKMEARRRMSGTQRAKPGANAFAAPPTKMGELSIETEGQTTVLWPTTRRRSAHSEEAEEASRLLQFGAALFRTPLRRAKAVAAIRTPIDRHDAAIRRDLVIDMDEGFHRALIDIVGSALLGVERRLGFRRRLRRLWRLRRGQRRFGAGIGGDLRRQSRIFLGFSLGFCLLRHLLELGVAGGFCLDADAARRGPVAVAKGRELLQRDIAIRVGRGLVCLEGSLSVGLRR